MHGSVVELYMRLLWDGVDVPCDDAYKVVVMPFRILLAIMMRLPGFLDNRGNTWCTSTIVLVCWSDV